jgi:hypothetical protein
MPAPLHTLVPPELFTARRELLKKIYDHVTKNKLQTTIHATGDRMSATPQQFGMQIGKTMNKQAILGETGALLGAGLGAASGPEGHVLQNTGRGMVRGIGTELGGTLGGLGGGIAGAGLGGATGAGLGALLSLASRKRFHIDPTNLIKGMTTAGGLGGAGGGLAAGAVLGGRAGYDAAGKLMGPASYAKQAFMVGGTLGALGGLATGKPGRRGEAVGRGAVIGGGTELGMYPGALLGGLSGLALGGALGGHEAMPAAGALGTGIGALGGGLLGNIGARGLLDSGKNHPAPEGKDKKTTKEKPETDAAEEEDNEKESAIKAAALALHNVLKARAENVK